MREVDLGIDMGGTNIKLALVEKSGELIKAERVDAHSELDLPARLEKLATEIELILGAEFKLTGIGIAFPGIIDFGNRRILSKYVKYPGAWETDLEAWALRYWGIPLIVENDARAALVGEWQYGAGQGYRDLVMFTLGTGVGSAVLLDGKLLRGRNFLAGNLGGHMSIDYKGMRCSCGNIGCVETVGSTWAIPYHLKELGPLRDPDEEEVAGSFKEIFSAAAAAGDSVAIQIRDNSLEGWAAGLINFIQAFDPERVVIGGGIMQSKEVIIPFLEDRVAAHSWLDQKIDIVTAEQMRHAGILGMCYLLNNQL